MKFSKLKTILDRFTVARLQQILIFNNNVAKGQSYIWLYRERQTACIVLGQELNSQVHNQKKQLKIILIYLFRT